MITSGISLSIPKRVFSQISTISIFRIRFFHDMAQIVINAVGRIRLI